MQRPKRKSAADGKSAGTQTAGSASATAELSALRKQLLEIIVRREEQRKAKPK
jgi:hypothetical protein